MAGAVFVILAATPLGYYLYVEHEKERLMLCVYNAALLRGGAGAAATEKAAREGAEKMLQSGLMSTTDAYKMAATIFGCRISN